MSRLTEYQNLYLQCSNIDSFEKLKHDNLYHLFVNSLPDDVRQFVRSKQPKNVTEAAEFADLCFSIKFDQTKKGSFARRSSPAAFNNVQVEAKQFKNDVAH